MAEEMRAKVKDVKAACRRIHEGARSVGAPLDGVDIVETRTVGLCSHEGHAPFVSEQWTLSVRPCIAVESKFKSRLNGLRISSATLDGLTLQADQAIREAAEKSKGVEQA